MPSPMVGVETSPTTTEKNRTLTSRNPCVIFPIGIMITCGVDVGSLTVKAILLRDRHILAYSQILSREEAAVASQKVVGEVLESAGLTSTDVQYVVSTGVGRKEVPFADENVTTPFAISVGATEIFPLARTIIDLGAENCVVVTCDDKGQMVKFGMNDKCAAGTGIFLETMAEALEVTLEDMGRLSLESKNKTNISSMCAVFAESEVVGYVHTGINKVDIIRGLHDAISVRIVEMLNRVRFKREVVIVGGVARNIGLVASLENMLGFKILIPENPTLVGALGAALVADNRGNVVSK